MSFLSNTKERLEHNIEKTNVRMDPEVNRRTCVIDGRLYMDTGKDDIFTNVPSGMDDARDQKKYPAPDYVVRNGETYEIVNGRKYMNEQREMGAQTLTAKKAGKVVIMDVKAGDSFTVWTNDGKAEASEVLAEGSHVIAKADEHGNAIVDEHGHTNMWQIKDEKLHSRYAVSGDIEPGASFAPAGKPQDFVQVDKNVAVMCPWGEGGTLIPQTVGKGGYLTSSSPDDCYGIAKAEFDETYKVLQDKTKGKEREIPMIDGMDSSESEMQY